LQYTLSYYWPSYT